MFIVWDAAKTGAPLAECGVSCDSPGIAWQFSAGVKKLGLMPRACPVEPHARNYLERSYT